MENTICAVEMRVLGVAFDVSSDRLDGGYLLSSRLHTVVCRNESTDIRATLLSIQELANTEGYGEVRVLCESTGIYHRCLLEIASRLGMRTNLVSGEAVCAQRKVRFNDVGKNDQRDAEVILDVGRYGRLIRHRRLQAEYDQLRELHRIVCRYESNRRRYRNFLHAELRILFRDLRISNDVLYGATGKALMLAFGCNPARIVAAGRESFERQIKDHSRYTKSKTLAKIWDQAVASCKDGVSQEVLSIREEHVVELYETIVKTTEKAALLEDRMIGIYQKLQEEDGRLPSAEKGVVSWRMLSRIVAETGPLSDFRTVKQLMRYAGLNLLERQSGKYKGQLKISRRGRSALRDVLNRLSLPLTTRKGLYGAYYHRKREVDRMPGDKAMTCVMRKFLKMFFGWYRSGEAFDVSRVFDQSPSVVAA